MPDSDCTLDIDGFVDSDWAGCRTTRKSTIGTVVQLLNSTVSCGSRTQGTIALVREKQHYTDSTAGKSMAARFGTSKKTKHVELRFLYVQGLVAKGILRLRKVGTKVNCAHVLTKYFSSELLVSHLRKLSVFTFLDHFQL